MELIRFQCPACSASLTVPPSAAGMRGPCPKCASEIIGPDPTRGYTARIASLPPEHDPDSDPLPEDHPSPPERAPADTNVPSPGKAGFSAAVLVLTALVVGGLAYVAGLATGGRQADADKPVYTTQPMVTAEDTGKLPVPVRNMIPAVPVEDPSAPSTAGPEATLRAFLEAETWKTRSAQVLFSENFRQQMEERAARSGDGPIETTEVSLLHINPNAHIFQVATPKIPKGFPVAVARTSSGWKVDWQTFVEFHDDRFSRFAAGKEGDNGVFHLMVNPIESENPEELFARYRLSPPMPDREQTGYVSKESVALARLKNIFDEQAGLSNTDFRNLLEGAGPPMVLALSYKRNSEDQPYLQIDDVIAIGWGPGEP